MNVTMATATVFSAVVLGIGVPWLTIRMLAPALEAGRLAENYRGRRVYAGLGVAWLVWAGSAILMGVLGSWWADARSMIALLTLAGPLALVAFSLGLFDDAYGGAGARGFRGHLTAMARGRLTTGGLKLIGISLAAFVVGLIVAEAAMSGRRDMLVPFVLAVPYGMGIALTSNFVNLMDLRPGRALKVYLVLGLAGVVSVVLGLAPVVGSPWSTRLLDAGVFVLFIVGPVIATWRYDLGELGMLGDAGANPAGAVAGLFIVSGLSWWALIIYVLVMLAANLVSERVSFSQVISNNPFLSRIDALGREQAGTGEAGAQRSLDIPAE